MYDCISNRGTFDRCGCILMWRNKISFENSHIQERLEKLNVRTTVFCLNKMAAVLL